MRVTHLFEESKCLREDDEKLRSQVQELYRIWNEIKEEFHSSQIEIVGKETVNLKEVECKCKCDETLTSSEALKKASQKKPPKKISCKHCEETFLKIWKVEKSS